MIALWRGVETRTRDNALLLADAAGVQITGDDMKLPNDHQTIEVESYVADKGEGRGQMALRPVKGQKFPQTMALEGNKSLLQDYPAGTRFRVQVSPMQRPGGEAYLFSSWQWDAKVISQPETGL